MSNDLTTVLDNESNRALVREFFLKTFLERRTYDTVLANSQYLQRLTIPSSDGQYVTAYRQNFLRLPEKVNLANETADPASGATISFNKVKLPLEFVHEYVGIGTIAGLTSWADLKQIAREHMPIALMRQLHRLTQAAFIVGRYQPGRYAADGSVSVAFDTVVEATAVSLYGTPFTWTPAPKWYARGRLNYGLLQPDDTAIMQDFKNIHSALSLAGAPKINGKYVAHISDPMKQDLMADDEYFRAAVHAFNGKGLVENQIADYMGFHWVIDDEPYTTALGTEDVRVTNGAVHTAIITGKNAAAYVGLGGSSSVKPTFKLQDITKTGSEYTIGYMVPFQAGVTNPAWCATYKALVSQATPNNE